MLTRLKVSGFKNLVDVDVSFGPFTCVAGVNGVGKSNLFDAITFLSALASDTLMSAALSVRDVGGRAADVRSLIHRVGDIYDDRMSFEAEMIVPAEGVDDLGQPAKAKTTFLRYVLELGYRVDESLPTLGSLQLLREELDYIKPTEAGKHLGFQHAASKWRKSVILGASRSPFISTIEDEDVDFLSRGEDNEALESIDESLTGRIVKSSTEYSQEQINLSPLAVREEMPDYPAKGTKSENLKPADQRTEHLIIKLHQDGSQGRPKSFLAANLPRTVLSTVNATESPTALLARREMQSWRLLQLEPSALREPDTFATAPGLGSDGSHLPATLYSLARTQKASGQSESLGLTWIYDQVAARLSQLIEDIFQVAVDRDEKRELLTLEVMDFSGTPYPARSLSDGTLRFLALAVLELDLRAGGLICLEEPENGIHPERIPAVLRLLQDMTTDVNNPVGSDNPLRQVIINTHSPAVVAQVPDDSLLVAELKETVRDKQRFKRACFSWLPQTWRAEACPDIPAVARGKLLAYLNPFAASLDQRFATEPAKSNRRRVIDRSDLQLMLPLESEVI